MDLIKKLTGKNPSEYELIAKNLVNNSDTELFRKLVEQDDFLFDFIKANVAKRIMHACNETNYLNVLSFFEYYSPSYDTMLAEVLRTFGGDKIYDTVKDIYLNGTNPAKAYAAKYLSLADPELTKDLTENIRKSAESEYEPLSTNSIELLSILNDTESKERALFNLKSEDEFEVLKAVKFLTIYGAKDCLPQILESMKKSGFSENIASEIPYLAPLVEIMENDRENALLIACYIINAIPDILLPSAVLEYDLGEFIENVLSQKPDSVSAVLLRLAKDKFEELATNEEYLFDSDKNTKDEIKRIYEMLKGLNNDKLKSLLYDELFEGSDFVFFAVDYTEEIEELETLLESSNQTLILKVLGRLKDLGALKPEHKEKAMSFITVPEIKTIANVL